MAKSRDIHFLGYHRNMKESNLVEAQWMHAVGIQTPQIFDLQAHYSGGYSKLGYTEKNL